MVNPRDGHLHIGKLGIQPIPQHGAHHILRGEVPCVDKIQAQGLSIQKPVIFHICGHKGITAQGQGVPHHIRTGTAPHRHLAHRPSAVHQAYAVGTKLLLDKTGKILQGLFLKDITMSAALDSSARIAAITAVSMLCAIWMFTRKA